MSSIPVPSAQHIKTNRKMGLDGALACSACLVNGWAVDVRYVGASTLRERRAWKEIERERETAMDRSRMHRSSSTRRRPPSRRKISLRLHRCCCYCSRPKTARETHDVAFAKNVVHVASRPVYLVPAASDFAPLVFTPRRLRLRASRSAPGTCPTVPRPQRGHLTVPSLLLSNTHITGQWTDAVLERMRRASSPSSVVTSGIQVPQRACEAAQRRTLSPKRISSDVRKPAQVGRRRIMTGSKSPHTFMDVGSGW
ncbi:hypothetical protein C8Q76DRAFT_298884 [Earliella scabrosa]|nr:hypothetical protein C8Q76DRAFT_298884 [Earliella scabrosa]